MKVNTHVIIICQMPLNRSGRIQKCHWGKSCLQVYTKDFFSCTHTYNILLHANHFKKWFKNTHMLHPKSNLMDSFAPVTALSPNRHKLSWKYPSLLQPCSNNLELTRLFFFFCLNSKKSSPLTLSENPD